MIVLENIEEGSAIVSLSPMTTQITLPEETSEKTGVITDKIFDDINDILNTLGGEDEKLAFEKLNERFSSELSLRVLLRFSEIVNLFEFYKLNEYGIKAAEEIPDKFVNICDHTISNRIKQWLEKYEKQMMNKIRGVVVRVKTDGPTPNFSIKTFESEIIRAPLDFDRDNDVIYNSLEKRTPIEIHGVIHHRGVNREIAEIHSIEEITSDTISKLPANFPYALKKPLDVIRYIDRFEGEDFWVIKNEELNICGVGDTYDEAYEDFLATLEATLDHYLNTDDSELSQSGMALKRKLLEYFIRR